MRFERKFALISILLMLARTGASQDEPRLKPPFSVALNAERLEVKPGAPIPVRLTMRNTSDHDLRFSVQVMQVEQLDYVAVTIRQVQVQLHDSDGNPVPLTLYGKALRGQAGGGFGKFIRGGLRVGESLTEEADLSKEFEIKKPGKYTVRAERLDEKSKAMVKTEPVTVTVTAAQ